MDEAKEGILMFAKSFERSLFGTSSLKSTSSPFRVSNSVGNYGASKGTSAITGHPVTAPFKKAISSFGKFHRKGIKALSSVRTGK